LPVKGGTRFSEYFNLDEAMSHASLTTFRYSLANIPFGGGSGGIKINPKTFSKSELERLTRRYTI
jgi:glutamate dehydrogenase (NAD(P)+)